MASFRAFSERQTPLQRLGIKPQPTHLWNLQVQLSHSSLNPLAFESVSIASPTGCSLVRFRSQKLASFQLHRHVEQLLQDSSKGFCSFLDQLRQDLPWYSLFQIWVHLILLARFSFLFLENPVPDLCLSDPRPDQKLQKKSYTTTGAGSEGLTLAAELIEQDWDRMVTFYNYPKKQWQHLRTTNPVGVTVCRSSAANGRGQAIQESGKRPGGDLEDAAGGGAAIPPVEGTGADERRLPGRQICQWSPGQPSPGGESRLMSIYTLIDGTSRKEARDG